MTPLRSLILAIVCAGLGVALGAPAPAPSARPAPISAAPTIPSSVPASPPPLEAQQITNYLKQTLDWYHGMQALAARPRFAQDVVARTRLRISALGAVRLAFQFAHAAAALLAPAPSTAAGNGPAQSAESRLTKASARIDARIAALHAQLSKLDTSLAHAPARTRAALQAQRKGLQSALQLEQEVKSAVQDLLRFRSSTFAVEAQGARGLAGEIEVLERTVPELRATEGVAAPARRGAPAAGAPASTTASVAAVAPTVAPAASVQAESAGIITLIGEWIGLQSDARQLEGGAAATRALRGKLGELQTPLRGETRELMATSVTGFDSTDLAALDAAQRSLAAAASRFKQLAALLVPLGEQGIVLADTESALTQWTQSIRASQATIARYLLTKTAFLIVFIVAVLVVSEVWRRAVFRYFHDPRRRSQFQTLRRVAVGILLAAVIIFGLVSEIGSLATYVGFLTAGLAVALQNVILAVVGYFFLIGRFGVRIGDRITLAGVTGRVADIGLIRIYLLELAGQDLRPTGRVVVLSNAVLFQPQALFKQIPGADYLWHAISLALAPSTDVQAAQERFHKAVDTVYARYRPLLEKRHAAARHLVDFETPIPSPEVRASYAQGSLKFEVRYPVQADQAFLADREMLEALRQAVAAEPPLPLAASGEPALESAAA